MATDTWPGYEWVLNDGGYLRTHDTQNMPDLVQ